MKTTLTNFLVSFLTFIILLAVLEVCVRIFIPEEFYKLTIATTEWDPDPELGWKNKPFYEKASFAFGKPVLYKTNEDGFRPWSAIREKEPGVMRVMLFGNSTVTARDVPESETIHFYMDSLLNQNGQSYEVINAGVLGYATDQALIMMDRYIDVYDPDVVCYGYCINDLYANLSSYYSGLYKPWYQLTTDSLILNLPEKENEDIVEVTKNTSFKDLIQHSALYGVLRPYIQQVRIMLSKQAELDQGGIQDLAKYENPVLEDMHFILFSRLLEKMQQVCDRNGAKFLFYAHPEVVTVWEPYRQEIGKEEISPYLIEHKLEEIADLSSVRFAPMVDHFLDNHEQGPFHLLPRDPHCNGKGYELQSEVLTSYVLGMEEETTADVISGE